MKYINEAGEEIGFPSDLKRSFKEIVKDWIDIGWKLPDGSECDMHCFRQRKPIKCDNLSYCLSSFTELSLESIKDSNSVVMSQEHADFWLKRWAEDNDLGDHPPIEMWSICFRFCGIEYSVQFVERPQCPETEIEGDQFWVVVPSLIPIKVWVRNEEKEGTLARVLSAASSYAQQNMYSYEKTALPHLSGERNGGEIYYQNTYLPTRANMEYVKESASLLFREISWVPKKKLPGD